jgi:hypothetical protein
LAAAGLPIALAHYHDYDTRERAMRELVEYAWREPRGTARFEGLLRTERLVVRVGVGCLEVAEEAAMNDE